MSRFVYADHAATTALSPAALEAMRPYFQEKYGNPSSLYRLAGEAKAALEGARAGMAACLGAAPEEIFFTSGGTEADNWALLGAAAAAGQGKGGHIITSAVEHHAVLHTAQYLEKQGFAVTYLPVDGQGRVDPAEVEAALRPDTFLISVMAANNEIGTIQPVAEIGAIARARASSSTPTRCRRRATSRWMWGPGGRICSPSRPTSSTGPRGWGCSICAGPCACPPSSTAAARRGAAGRARRTWPAPWAWPPPWRRRWPGWRPRQARLDGPGGSGSWTASWRAVPRARLTGPRQGRLPGSASFVFECVEGESILLRLDGAGICASSGSACSSASLDPSHVLLAIGLPHEIAHGSLRLTLGRENTEEDVDYLLETVPRVVAGLRAMSPLWDDN